MHDVRGHRHHTTAAKTATIVLLAGVAATSACTQASPTAAPPTQTVILAATQAPGIPPAPVDTGVPTTSQTTEPSPTPTPEPTPTVAPATATPPAEIRASCYPDASAPLEDLVVLKGPEHLFDPSCQVSGGVGQITSSWDIDGDGTPESEELDPPPLALEPGEYNPVVTFADETGQVAAVELPRIVKVGEPSYPSWRYGVHLDYQGGNIADDAASIALVSRYAEMFSGIGVEGVRLDFAWTSLEPSNDRFSFGIHDQAVAILRDHGMDVVGIIAWTPSWASSSSTEPWKHMPREIDDFSDYVYQLTSHYRGRVNSWLIWNEPNVSIYFDSLDPAEYVRLLKAGYVAAKYGSPESTVILGGLANDESEYQPQLRWYPPEQFLQAVYDLGGREYFDAVGRHPYTHPLYGGYDEIVSKISAIKDVMARNGDQNKPLYLDEVGYGLIWDVTEDLQAQWLYEIFRAARQTAVPLLIVFDCQDWPGGSDFEQTIGLLRLDGSPRPVFDAYADIIRQGQ